MQARSNTNKAKQHSTPKAVTLLEKMSCLGWDMYMYCMRIANALRRGLALLCLSFNRGWWIGVAVISKTRHPARRSCRGFESRTHAGGLQALGKQARRRSRVILFSCGKQQCRRDRYRIECAFNGSGFNAHSLLYSVDRLEIFVSSFDYGYMAKSLLLGLLIIIVVLLLWTRLSRPLFFQ